jgi:hypothetical protein
MNTKQILLSIALLCSSPFLRATGQVVDRYVYPKVTLESEVLSFIDGISGMGIDGNTLGMMIHLRNEQNKIRFGVKGKDGNYTGMYIFEGKKHSVATMATIEPELMALAKSNSIKDQNRYKEYKEVLETVKKDFIKMMLPFLADARGAKEPVMVLIKEWAHLTHRSNSHLLDWFKTPEGKEADEFFEKGTSFNAIEEFIADLTHFLETLCRSCPKAAKHFKELIAQKESIKPGK